MKNGLYELPLVDSTKHKIIRKEKIEKVDLPKVLSKSYEKKLRQKLEGLKEEEILDFYKQQYASHDSNTVYTSEFVTFESNNTYLKEYLKESLGKVV